MKQTEPTVIHHLEYVRMTAHHKTRPAIDKRLLNARSILPRISSDMTQMHTHTLYLKHLDLAACAAHLAAVDIARDRTHHRSDLLQPPHDTHITDITRMPNLVTIIEMRLITFVPARMRIRQYTYPFHLLYLFMTSL